MKPQILLIEDCAVTRFGVVRYFSKDGYQISEAGSLAEATRLMADRRFDLIIIDINLPDGNGLDMISAEREAQNLVPIIVVTGAGDIPLAVEAMQRGADNFLTSVDMALDTRPNRLQRARSNSRRPYGMEKTGSLWVRPEDGRRLPDAVEVSV